MSNRILTIRTLAAVALTAACGAVASAQPYYMTGVNPYVGYGGYYYGGYQASTAAEGYLRGYADLVRARGIASLYHAQALSQLEMARAQDIDNRRLYLQFVDDFQQGLDARSERNREESLRRLAQREKWMAAERKAKGEKTGNVSIDWPAAVSGERYEPIRREIEGLANLRMELGDNAGESSEIAIHHAIRLLAKQIMAEEDAGAITAQESQVVRPFVRSLAANILRASPEEPQTMAIAATGAARQR